MGPLLYFLQFIGIFSNSLLGGAAITSTILLATSTTTSAASPFPFLPVNPWESFKQLAGLHLGDHRFGLSYLKRYLSRFGYLPDSNTFSDDFDAALESALLAYQQNFHLNLTGYLDPSTLELMIQPRCGVADLVNGSMVHGRNLYSYFPNRPTWPPRKRALTYAFTFTSAVSIRQTVMRTVFARAFARWAEVTMLTFTEITSADQADITIGFLKGNHGDGEPFDGVLGILAHSFSPTDGRFHLDAAETWVAVAENMAAPELFTSSTAIDLESVAVHEIGHLLGLGHSTVEGTIMYPTIGVGTRRVQLESDDVQGIQSLYGNNPSYNGTTFTTSTNTMTESGGGVRLGDCHGGAAAAGRMLSAGLVVALFVL